MPPDCTCGPDRAADRQSVNLTVGRCTTIQELLLVLARGRARGQGGTSRTLFFSHSSRTAICRTHFFEIPTASPIALSVAPAFRAFAIALLRLTPRVISCCILGITALSTRLRSFMRAAALSRASFSCRTYEG